MPDDLAAQQLVKAKRLAALQRARAIRAETQVRTLELDAKRLRKIIGVLYQRLQKGKHHAEAGTERVASRVGAG